MKSPVEFEDVQGLVRFGHGHMTEALFLLLAVKDREAARAWLELAPVTNAVQTRRRPSTALQVALSSEGLRALGIADEIVSSFSAEFIAGLADDENRSRRLGDTGDSRPAAWEWGGPGRVPHVLVMVYGEKPAFARWRKEIADSCKPGFKVLASLNTATMDEFEPFGFKDGLSQPDLDWERRRPAVDREVREYTNLSCLGEFLLGYPNEYGMYTDRPLLEVTGAVASLPRAEDDPERADLGRNGSYLVFRQLHQDVSGFWRYLDRQAGGDAGLRTFYAESMVGRTIDGRALVPTGGGSNNFDFSRDPEGLQCPFGAHIRRANPRNGDLPPGDCGVLGWLRRSLGFDPTARENDIVASTRFHRLLRRARKYGRQLSVDEALADLSGAGGLHFICLNANIARQFEFVQSAWMIGTRFDGLNREGDPLLGERTPDLDGGGTDGFSMPQQHGPDQKLTQLPRFVQVKGGAYFFLPGIRALRYLARAI